MATRTHDITVSVAPGLRGAFDGRRELSLGVPATAGIGDVVEALLRLYPRTRQLLAGDGGEAGGPYLHMALDEASARELSPGGGGMPGGCRLYVFALSRPPKGGRTGGEG
ncbi:hypothetical protein D7W82_25420 [Corallococcus sp. CA049B]|uniref:MoaD/ThiS family protein n=1 Tax=Corallococcus sp. CA049B TaxID=2316730 RepID=UPI000EA0827C|nr:MoaD/ThiS family protein [Corallococcus sp. CA049B]NOJ96733.1 MoaD/ThiS family protein [Corallococcus coralloides]RKG83324.1 hypothetical protein D7W82_25420 [Corallococcus sp. CA049B]